MRSSSARLAGLVLVCAWPGSVWAGSDSRPPSPISSNNAGNITPLTTPTPAITPNVEASAPQNPPEAALPPDTKHDIALPVSAGEEYTSPAGNAQSAAAPAADPASIPAEPIPAPSAPARAADTEANPIIHGVSTGISVGAHGNDQNGLLSPRQRQGLARLLTDPFSGTIVLKENERTHELEGHTDAVRWLQFSPNGKTVVSAGHDGHARVWDVARGNMLQVFHHGADIRSGALSLDGKLFTGGYDGLVHAWLMDSRRELDPYPLRFDPAKTESPQVWSLNLGATGNLFAGGNDGRVFLLLSDGRRRSFGQEGGMPVLSLAAGLNPRYFFTGSYDGARMWEVLSGESRRFLPAHKAEINPDLARAVEVSEDGRHLFTGAADGFIHVWDTATSNILRVLSGHTNAIWSLARVLNGFLLSAGDTTARLWDTATGKELLRIEHSRGVSAAAASPDGRYLATAARDNKIRLWEIPH